VQIQKDSGTTNKKASKIYTNLRDLIEELVNRQSSCNNIVLAKVLKNFLPDFSGE
jgi:hypothetical protein